MLFALLFLGAIGHIVLWVGIVNRLHGLGIHRHIVDAATLLSGIILVGLPLLVAAALWSQWWGNSPTVASWAAWAYVSACAILFIGAAVRRLLWRYHAERRNVLISNHSSRVNLAESADEPLTAHGLPRLLSRIPGNEVLNLCVQEKTLGLPRLAGELASLRIVHITDLHMSGRITKRYFEQVAAEVNERDADIIAITGDVVERAECLDWVPDTLGQLRARHGVFYVLGNHDRHVGRERVVAALNDAGLIYLGGGCHRTTIRGVPVILGGNELPWFGPACDFGTSAAQPSDGPSALQILLAHTPDQFAWAQANGVDLMLAGHNHGGQVCFPLLGPVLAPSRFGVRYAGGTFLSGNTVLHVSRGTSSLTPVRWNCPPEIAVLTLQAASVAVPRTVAV